MVALVDNIQVECYRKGSCYWLLKSASGQGLIKCFDLGATAAVMPLSTGYWDTWIIKPHLNAVSYFCHGVISAARLCRESEVILSVSSHFNHCSRTTHSLCSLCSSLHAATWMQGRQMPVSDTVSMWWGRSVRIQPFHVCVPLHFCFSIRELSVIIFNM